MSSLLLSRLSRLCLSKPPALRHRRYLGGARFFSETPIYRIVRADHCQDAWRDRNDGRLVVRNVNASEEDEDEVLEKMVPMDLMTETGTIGASHGWVATWKYGLVCLQDDLNPGVSDSDPKRILLAPVETLPHCQTELVTNVAMSSSSPDEDEDCIVAVKFMGPQLSLYKPAQDRWVNIRVEDPAFFSSRVMYSKRDKMFSMPGCGGTHIGSWDLEKHRSQNLRLLYDEFLQSEWKRMSRYCRIEQLVEAPTGETFMVKWYTEAFGTKGMSRWKRFLVFTITIQDGNRSAEVTDNIKDLCIFLSTKGEPFCLTASLYGLTPNCIYYVGDFDFGKVNIGDNVWVGRNVISPAPYFIPPQSS